ncbi:MAG: cell wall hydrolase [Dethiobacter sp.]|jgi:spore germination cell wall hydrolase CwlJ-like protein|nr:MAG: cell wall hydrolase [Dethiobacter sp.]
MKKYLAIVLCFPFLMGNPSEAAILAGNVNDIPAENFLLMVKEKEDGETNLTSSQEEINRENGDNETENPENDSPYSPEDIDLLARLVHAEAKGETYQGKIAVAATVLNRIKSADYPDTIPGVIYQNNQYCPVRNGQINRPADEDAFRAVEEALEGNDPTGGALSFFNPSKSSNRWIRSRPYLTRIGNHIFVK